MSFYKHKYFKTAPFDLSSVSSKFPVHIIGLLQPALVHIEYLDMPLGPRALLDLFSTKWRHPIRPTRRNPALNKHSTGVHYGYSRPKRCKYKNLYVVMKFTFQLFIWIDFVYSILFDIPSNNILLFLCGRRIINEN